MSADTASLALYHAWEALEDAARKRQPTSALRRRVIIALYTQEIAMHRMILADPAGFPERMLP